MGRLIDTSNIRVKPQYMQDVMGIAMIRCEDLSRILADVPTVEAIPKDQYEARLKADMAAMLTDLMMTIGELDNPKYKIVCNTPYEVGKGECLDLIQERINALKGENT